MKRQNRDWPVKLFLFKQKYQTVHEGSQNNRLTPHSPNFLTEKIENPEKQLKAQDINEFINNLSKNCDVNCKRNALVLSCDRKRSRKE